MLTEPKITKILTQLEEFLASEHAEQLTPDQTQYYLGMLYALETILEKKSTKAPELLLKQKS